MTILVPRKIPSEELFIYDVQEYNDYVVMSLSPTNSSIKIVDIKYEKHDRDVVITCYGKLWARNTITEFRIDLSPSEIENIIVNEGGKKVLYSR